MRQNIISLYQSYRYSQPSITIMSFNAYKQRVLRPVVCRPYQHELEKPPRQFCDFMNETNNRFCEICKIYLDGMSMDDVSYLKPEDLINLVPPENYRHKLLMTIMVRRYLYRRDDLTNGFDNSDNMSDNASIASTHSTCCKPILPLNNCVSSCKNSSNDRQEFACCNCDHVCTNPNCSHSCDNYTKILIK